MAHDHGDASQLEGRQVDPQVWRLPCVYLDFFQDLRFSPISVSGFVIFFFLPPGLIVCFKMDRHLICVYSCLLGQYS